MTLGEGKEVFIFPGAGKKLTLGRGSNSLSQVLKQDSGQRLQGGKNRDPGNFSESFHWSCTSISNLNITVMLYSLMSLIQIWDINSYWQFSDLQPSLHSLLSSSCAASWGSCLLAGKNGAKGKVFHTDAESLEAKQVSKTLDNSPLCAEPLHYLIHMLILSWRPSVTVCLWRGGGHRSPLSGAWDLRVWAMRRPIPFLL